MLRARLPGGIISTQQWLAIDKFAEEKSIYGSIRFNYPSNFSVPWGIKT